MELQKNLLSNLLDFAEKQYFDTVSPKYRGVETFRNSLINSVESDVRSPNWNTGGNWVNCWGDNTEITPGKPENFSNSTFEFLKSYYSELNVHSNDFDNACVIHNESQADYYGGRAFFSYKTLSLKSLETLLLEKGVESPSEAFNVYQAVEDRVKENMEILVKTIKMRR